MPEPRDRLATHTPPEPSAPLPRELAGFAAAAADRYAIVREIGRGGMATVYLARDLKHERLVALKVLNPELGAVLGTERFLAEIRVTANLQHPNLLPLFDSGAAAGLLFYVMPYVEGESLRARLEREKQLPVDEAVRIAVAVADALEYAHRHGVIHRDLKPENILLAGDPHKARVAHPLVADFGIALAVSNAGGARITQTGLSLGTPQYMSPEQATGDRAIDVRSDVYSLAAVLYEMLTGEPPHAGTTAQAVIARLLTEEPRPLTQVRRTVPRHVEAAVQCALAKLPADRFPTVRELAEALVGRGPGAAFASASRLTWDGHAGPPRPRWARRVALPLWGAALAAAAAVAAAAVAAWALLRPAAPTSPPTWTEVALPAGHRFFDLSSQSVAIAPDGETIVYTALEGATRRLYARRARAFGVEALPGTDNAYEPFVSPDGRWVAYTAADGALRKVALAGGASVVLASAAGRGGTWTERDEIVFSDSGMLKVVPAEGGAARAVLRPDTARGERALLWPRALPGGDAVLYVSDGGGISAMQVGVLDLRSGERALLGQPGTSPRYASGALLVARADGSLLAAPFDLRRRRLTGAAVPVVDSVLVRSSGAAAFDVSATGTLVAVQASDQWRVFVADRRGRADTLIGAPRQYYAPRLSPDGRRLALQIGGDRGEPSDIWVYTLGTAGTLMRLTFGGVNAYPEWTADGRHIVFSHAELVGQPSDLWWVRVDGSVRPEPILTGPGSRIGASLTPDGRALVYRSADKGAQARDVSLAPLAAAPGDARAARALLSGPYIHRAPRVSPDGRRLVYGSNESGHDEIYVRSLPDMGRKVQVSTAGGIQPLWSRDGRQVFYWHDRTLFAAQLATSATGDADAVTSREALFDAWHPANPNHAHYDVTPDGERFVLVRPVSEEPRLVVVTNWFKELHDRLAGPARR